MSTATTYKLASVYYSAKTSIKLSSVFGHYLPPSKDDMGAGFFKILLKVYTVH